MQLFATILEETAEAALRVVRELREDCDGIEVRAESFASLDLHALRAATAKPLILTYRGAEVPDARAAFEAGIDFVDVEWREDVEIVDPARTVLSHHDYEGMRDVEQIVAAMRARGCAHTKLAATPRNFADNERLLALLAPSVSVIGMSERGLYSRILAPFRGSALTFVAATNLAAPGQLTLERALAIYGDDRANLRAEKVFAVAGNPAGHSLSPSIHNALFRAKGVSAAYTIASVESFAELTDAFLRGEPCGLSVTAPFKDDAFAFATSIGAELGVHALRARAVNTLVNLGERILADNTDVDGFATLIAQLAPRPVRAAIVGAGGTARAARVALEDAGIACTTYNRTASKADAPLDALASSGADLIINTLPAGARVDIPLCRAYIEAAYSAAPRESVDSGTRIDGLALLHAQAQRQHELFMRVFEHGS
ncbi:MAG: type I 3-dehydroquinate dehydratase [Acidobacteria bacterium]|nr:type I 3-dehydroquinate dehydratase [Acidobacteriota bacterium]MBV9476570.1 type I 3-dehydroquinate dehydratase [Acidobacteriota bacterium]